MMNFTTTTRPIRYFLIELTEHELRDAVIDPDLLVRQLHNALNGHTDGAPKRKPKTEPCSICHKNFMPGRMKHHIAIKHKTPAAVEEKDSEVLDLPEPPPAQ